MKKFLVILLTCFAVQSTIAAPVVVIARPAPVIVRPAVVAPRITTPVAAPKVAPKSAVTEPVKAMPTPVIVPQFANTASLCTDAKKKNNQC